MADPELLLDVADAVGRVTLNRPEQRNALSAALLDDLVDALTALAADDTVRVVVLTGAGGDFSVGADMASLASVPYADGDETQQVEALLRHSRASLLLREMPKVTIAGIEGACAGAGLGLAMAADLRLASSGALLKAAFVNAGMSGDFGLAWSLSRILGDADARRLLLEDPKMDAATAADLGLVTRTASAEEYADTLQAWAARLASLPPLAVAGIKANLADAGLGFAHALARESPRHIRCARSADALEAARAFVDRRPGRYSGS